MTILSICITKCKTRQGTYDFKQVCYFTIGYITKRLTLVFCNRADMKNYNNVITWHYYLCVIIYTYLSFIPQFCQHIQCLSQRANIIFIILYT